MEPEDPVIGALLLMPVIQTIQLEEAKVTAW